jgi:hypothetical protein
MEPYSIFFFKAPQLKPVSFNGTASEFVVIISYQIENAHVFLKTPVFASLQSLTPSICSSTGNGA